MHEGPALFSLSTHRTLVTRVCESVRAKSSLLVMYVTFSRGCQNVAPRKKLAGPGRAVSETNAMGGILEADLVTVRRAL